MAHVVAPGRDVMDLGDPDEHRRLFDARTLGRRGQRRRLYGGRSRRDGCGDRLAGQCPGPAGPGGRHAEAGLPLVHVSTDYVFDGPGPRPMSRPIRRRPARGLWRLQGGRRAGGAHGQSVGLVILRYGLGGQFPALLLELPEDDIATPRADRPPSCAVGPVRLSTSADRHRPVPLIRSPTGSWPTPHAPRGTYHFVNAGEASWHGWPRHLLTRRGLWPGRRPGRPRSRPRTIPPRRDAGQFPLSTQKICSVISRSPRGLGGRRSTTCLRPCLPAYLRGTLDEGHCPGRRRRHAPASGDAGDQQATAADLRQADDLLSDVGADAGRHQGNSDHLVAGDISQFAPVRRRLRTGRTVR